MQDEKFMTTVKIGPKGQIVIPKEVRDMFGLNSGDSLVLMADKERGIGLQKAELLDDLMKAIFNGKKNELTRKLYESDDKEIKGGE